MQAGRMERGELFCEFPWVRASELADKLCALLAARLF
jgi:hypothetical protein